MDPSGIKFTRVFPFFTSTNRFNKTSTISQNNHAGQQTIPSHIFLRDVLRWSIALCYQRYNGEKHPSSVLGTYTCAGYGVVKIEMPCPRPELGWASFAASHYLHDQIWENHKVSLSSNGSVIYIPQSNTEPSVIFKNIRNGGTGIMVHMHERDEMFLQEIQATLDLLHEHRELCYLSFRIHQDVLALPTIYPGDGWMFEEYMHQWLDFTILRQLVVPIYVTDPRKFFAGKLLARSIGKKWRWAAAMLETPAPRTRALVFRNGEPLKLKKIDLELPDLFWKLGMIVFITIPRKLMMPDTVMGPLAVAIYEVVFDIMQEVKQHRPLVLMYFKCHSGVQEHIIDLSTITIQYIEEITGVAVKSPRTKRLVVKAESAFLDAPAIMYHEDDLRKWARVKNFCKTLIVILILDNEYPDRAKEDQAAAWMPPRVGALSPRADD